MVVAPALRTRCRRLSDPSDPGLPHKQRGNKSEIEPDSAEHEHCHRCQVRTAAAALCLLPRLCGLRARSHSRRPACWSPASTAGAATAAPSTLITTASGSTTGTTHRTPLMFAEPRFIAF